MPGARDTWGALGGSWVKGTRGSPGADATTSGLRKGRASLQLPPSTPVGQDTQHADLLTPPSSPSTGWDTADRGPREQGVAEQRGACTSSHGHLSVYFIFQDGKIEAEDFTSRLYRELNSSPQPYLVPFLKVSVRPVDRLGCPEAGVRFTVVAAVFGRSKRPVRNVPVSSSEAFLGVLRPRVLRPLPVSTGQSPGGPWRDS